MTLNGRASMETYTRLAPSVDQAWVEQFVLEQRLLGVTGTRIGDSLAVVESHVADSGESAHAAFGDARAYAVEDAPQQAGRGIDRGWGLGIVLGLAGMLVATFSAQAGFSGESTLTVTVGVLVVLAIITVSAALLFFAPSGLLRVIATHPGRSWIGWLLLFAATVGALIAFRQPLGGIDIVVGLIAGAILLAAGVLLQLRAYRGGRVQDDPIVGPGEQPTRSSATVVAILVLPIATMAMIGVSWVLQQIPELF